MQGTISQIATLRNEHVRDPSRVTVLSTERVRNITYERWKPGESSNPANVSIMHRSNAHVFCWCRGTDTLIPVK
jgi:hypothetical protein